MTSSVMVSVWLAAQLSASKALPSTPLRNARKLNDQSGQSFFAPRNFSTRPSVFVSTKVPRSSLDAEAVCSLCSICCNCCCFELLLLSAFLSLDQLTLRTLFFFGGFLALLVFSWGFLIILLFTVICRLQPRDELGHQGLELLFRLAITQNIIFIKLLLSRMPVNKELVAEHALIVEQFAEGA